MWRVARKITHWAAKDTGHKLVRVIPATGPAAGRPEDRLRPGSIATMGAGLRRCDVTSIEMRYTRSAGTARQRHPFRADVILREHVRALDLGQGARVFDMTEKLPGQLDKVSVVPEPQPVGDGDPPSAVALLQADARMSILQRGDAPFECGADIRQRLDMEFGAPLPAASCLIANTARLPR